MAAPGLAEIQSYQGNANAGAAAGGANITEVNTASSLPYLQAAATMTAQATKAEADLYNKRVEDALTNLNAIDTAGIMNSDYKDVGKSVAGLYKNYYDNFDKVRNPLKDLAKAGELKQNEAQVRAMIAQSKGQKAVLDTSRNFIKENPVWNTPENQKILDTFENTPVAERKLFNLVPPFVADIKSLADVANKVATKKTATSDQVMSGKYIRTQTGEYVDSDAFDQAILAQLNSDDKFGNGLRSGFEQQYNAMDPIERQKYAGFDDFLLRNARAYKNLPQQNTNKLEEDRFAVQNDQQAFTAGQNALDRAETRAGRELQREIAGLKNTKVTPEQAGALKSQAMVTLFTDGSLGSSNALLQDIYGDNTKVEKTVKAMMPLTPGSSIMVPNGSEVKEQVPKISVISTSKQVINGKPTGNIIVHRVDNRTGKQVSGIVVTPQRADQDLNLILGKDKQALVQDGSRRWLKNRTGNENFDLERVRPIFDVQEQAPAAAPRKTSIKRSEITSRANAAGYTTPQQVEEYRKILQNNNIKIED